MRVRRLFGLAMLFALFGCSKQEAPVEVRKTNDAVKATVRGIFRLERSGEDAAEVRLTSIDVEGLDAAALRLKFTSFTNAAAVHLWMPGEKSWVVAEHPSTNRLSIAAAMEAVADDEVCTVSFPEIFASYAGTLEEIMPAFAAKLEGSVVPEWFVTKEVPEIAWLDWAELDEDILAPVRAEMRSMQVVRRLILEGVMASRQATDRAGEESVTDKWARAMARNPHDPLLLERLDTLEKNARGFLEVGKTLQAMKCYETIVLVNPKDASAVHNFGVCLQRIGRADMAKDVLEKAKELAERARKEQ